MKLKLFICILFFALLLGCTTENQDLYGDIIKIDVQKDENKKEVVVIKDKETLESIKKFLEKISWKNVKPSMARKQDVMITLTIDSNKKRLSKKCNIWYNISSRSTRC